MLLLADGRMRRRNMMEGLVNYLGFDCLWNEIHGLREERGDQTIINLFGQKMSLHSLKFGTKGLMAIAEINGTRII